MEHGIRTKLWKDVLELVNQYQALTQSRETPVVNYLPALKLREELALSLSDGGSSDEELLNEIRKYLHYSQKTNHPLFHNQLNAGANFESLVAELISSLTNTTMSTFEAAPVATLIEEKLIGELLQKVGFTEGDGIMLTGGSNANLMAIHLARSARFPEIKRTGNTHHKICVFVSEEAHYSHKKAMMLLGLGLDNLIAVKTDAEGRMLTRDLESKIQRAIADDRIPLMLCSTAGTTVLGAFDPILENSAICKKYGLWHHVDGAWGGAAMLSKKHAHLLEGLAEVDSYTFDAHKLLSTGLITSFFLTRQKGLLLEANSASGTNYLFHDYENAEFDTGRKSLQCGRKVDVLKLWLTWKSLGHQGMENFVDEQFAKKDYFTRLVEEHPRLRLIHHPEYLNVCFQVLPKAGEEINEYNYRLRFKVVQSGRVMVNYSTFPDGTVFFRQVFANFRTSREDLRFIVDTILEMAD